MFFHEALPPGSKSKDVRAGRVSRGVSPPYMGGCFHYLDAVSSRVVESCS